jgi:hypothetical protein
MFNLVVTGRSIQLTAPGYQVAIGFVIKTKYAMVPVIIFAFRRRHLSVLMAK